MVYNDLRYVAEQETRVIIHHHCVSTVYADMCCVGRDGMRSALSFNKSDKEQAGPTPLSIHISTITI